MMSSRVGSVTLPPQDLNVLSNYPLMPPPDGLKPNFGRNADSRNGAFFLLWIPRYLE